MQQLNGRSWKNVGSIQVVIKNVMCAWLKNLRLWKEKWKGYECWIREMKWCTSVRIKGNFFWKSEWRKNGNDVRMWCKLKNGMNKFSSSDDPKQGETWVRNSNQILCFLCIILSQMGFEFCFKFYFTTFSFIIDK